MANPNYIHRYNDQSNQLDNLAVEQGGVDILATGGPSAVYAYIQSILDATYAPIGGGSGTFVQPGLNITTGGTASAQIVNLAGSVSLTALTFFSLLRDNSANSVSGIYYKDPSTNNFINSSRFTYNNTNGLITNNNASSTAGLYVSDGGVTGATVFGSSSMRAPSVSGTSVSATTYYSGNTELTTQLTNKFNTVYAPISVQNQWLQNGTNITTGGTPNAPSANLSTSITLTSVTATNISATTFTEAGTTLANKYSPKDLTWTRNSSTYILALTDDNRVVDLSGASAQNLVVPRNAAVAFPIGSQIIVHQSGAGQVSFSADTGVSINNYNSQLKLIGQYASASLIKKDTNQWVLMGNTTT